MPGWVGGRNSMKKSNVAGQNQTDSDKARYRDTHKPHENHLSIADEEISPAPRVSSFPTLGASNVGVASLTMSGIFRQEPGRVGDHGVF